MRFVERILVPIDLSDGSRAAIDWAASVASQAEAEIDVLYVWTTLAYSPEVALGVGSSWPIGNEPMGTENEAFARSELQAFLAPLQGDLPVRLRLRVEEGDPADRILALAEDYDLIVMGTHGRTGLSRFFHGRTAETVLRRAHCPVMTVRMGDAPGPHRDDAPSIGAAE